MQSESTLGQSSRAFWPGSSHVRRLAVGGLVVVVAALAVGLSVGLSGGSRASASSGASSSARASSSNGASSSARASSSKSAPVKYGSIPDWLPKPKVQVNRVVQASVTHPALSAIEGATVAVQLAHGRVLATVVGPSVPASVSQDVEDHADAGSDSAPCTFTLTFKSAAGVVPIDPTTFSLLDERGQLHPFRISAAGGGPLPARVAPGRTLTLTIKTTLPEGEGALRWAPNGRNVVVGWVYGLELD